MDINGLDAQIGVPTPPTEVWTFWHKKFEHTKSISDIIKIIKKIDSFIRSGLVSEAVSLYVFKHLNHGYTDKLLKYPRKTNIFTKNHL